MSAGVGLTIGLLFVLLVVLIMREVWTRVEIVLVGLALAGLIVALALSLDGQS